MYTPIQYFQQSIILYKMQFADQMKLSWSQQISCFSLEEMIAEKCCSALTRRTPAIRDFFDLWYLQKQGRDIFAHKEVIIQKCKEITTLNRTFLNQYQFLESQIKTDLLPLLPWKTDFHLNDIYEQIFAFQKEIIKTKTF